MTVQGLLEKLKKLVEQDVANLEKRVLIQTDIKRYVIFDTPDAVHEDFRRVGKEAVVVIEAADD